MKTQSIYATILPFLGKQSVSHAILTLLNHFDDPEFDASFIQANGTYVPGIELLTAIRRVNELLGNESIFAQKVARELKDQFERPEFQEAIPVDEESQCTPIK